MHRDPVRVVCQLERVTDVLHGDVEDEVKLVAGRIAARILDLDLHFVLHFGVGVARIVRLPVRCGDVDLVAASSGGISVEGLEEVGAITDVTSLLVVCIGRGLPCVLRIVPDVASLHLWANRCRHRLRVVRRH